MKGLSREIEAFVAGHGVTRVPIGKAGEVRRIKDAPRVVLAAPGEGWRWYVVATEPHREGTAERNLKRAGFETWLPHAVRYERLSRKAFWTHKGPLYPGYVFVRFDVAVCQWGVIDETIGVLQLLCNAERPMPIRAGEVEKLRLRVAADGGALKLKSRWRAGDRARVIEGPLAGQVGQCLACRDGEVTLGLYILGRSVPIPLSEAQVEPA